jgi:hypothetical protein
MDEDWNDRNNWRKKIIVKWAQEDVEILYNVLNNNGLYVKLKHVDQYTI